MGTADVAGWYAAREGGQIVNYGVSIAHIPARMNVLGDPGRGLMPVGIGGSGVASEAQMAAMEALLREGLAQGAIAMVLAQPTLQARRCWRSSACSGSARPSGDRRISTSAAASRA